jgi:phosphoribosyl 1,2-cyclic phosphodiesterase
MIDMKVTFWGTRGSLATPDPETVRFGGNTSCVEVRASSGTILVLDAGTGIRRLGRSLAPVPGRMDILLTHLHLDHIQGLGFFGPLFQPEVEVHIWGPGSVEQSLEQRLARYLSPPLFPVHLRAVPSKLHLHELSEETMDIGSFHVTLDYVCHPNPTVGYRITDGDSTVTYLPDHEPALGMSAIPSTPEWTSGYPLAAGVDLLIHDAQYDDQEYPEHVGWGHSSMTQACDFAALCGVRMLVPFHHDPSHTDLDIDQMVNHAVQGAGRRVRVMPAMEGLTLQLRGGEVGAA